MVAPEDRDEPTGIPGLRPERGQASDQPERVGTPVDDVAGHDERSRGRRDPAVPAIRQSGGAEQPVDGVQLPVEVAGCPDREVVRDMDRCDVGRDHDVLFVS